MAFVTIVCAALIGWFRLGQGWIAHDEGQLGQAAVRVLDGQLPHRDFDDMYTGALSYLNALSFHLWGESSHSMRVMLFAWYLPFVFSVYWIGAMLVGAYAASLVAILAAAWSIPMYAAPMPSWYNLFFATWVTCALLAYCRTSKPSLLFLAGLLIGASVLFKISGILVLAAALLWLVLRSQEEGQNSRNRLKDHSRMPAWPTLLVSIALLVFASLSFGFVRAGDALMQAIHLALPFLALSAFVLWRELTFVERTSSDFFRLVRECAWLSSGALLPICLYVAYFYGQGAVGDLARGTLAAPKKRMEFAAAPFPHLSTFLSTIPLLLLLYPKLGGLFSAPKSNSGYGRPNEGRLWLVLAATGVAILILRNTSLGFNFAFHSVRNLAPLLVLGNLILLSTTQDSESRRILFLLTVVPFFVSLTQFPYAGTIYFFYAAPLLLLTALAAVRYQEWVPKRALATVAGFMIAFACCRFHNHLPVVSLHPAYKGGFEAAELVSDRSKLRVESTLAGAFNRMHNVVLENSAPDEIVFATPDAPEVSFLTKRPPLNGVMYEFFHDSIYQDLEQLKQELDVNNVNLVVIKESPLFSKPVSDAFREIALGDFNIIDSIHLDSEDRLMFTIYKRDARAAL